VIGAILAGGASSRFGGTPKGLETVAGARIIDRVAAALRTVASDVLLVSSAPEAKGWLDDARVCRDVRDGRGSLVGIHAAIACARAPVIVVAWDMPFVSADLLALLRDRGAGAAHAVIPVTPTGPEPCCAWYAPAALPAIDAMLDAGEFRLGALIDHLPSVEIVTPAEIKKLGDPARLFFNINTPTDLALAEAMATAAS
jgi:molybdopterin-guanine dinucleotide biosynthesis protein A